MLGDKYSVVAPHVLWKVRDNTWSLRICYFVLRLDVVVKLQMFLSGRLHQLFYEGPYRHLSIRMSEFRRIISLSGMIIYGKPLYKSVFKLGLLEAFIWFQFWFFDL